MEPLAVLGLEAGVDAKEIAAGGQEITGQGIQMRELRVAGDLGKQRRILARPVKRQPSCCMLKACFQIRHAQPCHGRIGGDVGRDRPRRQKAPRQPIAHRPMGRHAHANGSRPPRLDAQHLAAGPPHQRITDTVQLAVADAHGEASDAARREVSNGAGPAADVGSGRRAQLVLL